MNMLQDDRQPEVFGLFIIRHEAFGLSIARYMDDAYMNMLQDDRHHEAFGLFIAKHMDDTHMNMLQDERHHEVFGLFIIRYMDDTYLHIGTG